MPGQREGVNGQAGGICVIVLAPKQEQHGGNSALDEPLLHAAAHLSDQSAETLHSAPVSQDLPIEVF